MHSTCVHTAGFARIHSLYRWKQAREREIDEELEHVHKDWQDFKWVACTFFVFVTTSSLYVSGITRTNARRFMKSRR